MQENLFFFSFWTPTAINCNLIFWWIFLKICKNFSLHKLCVHTMQMIIVFAEADVVVFTLNVYNTSHM